MAQASIVSSIFGAQPLPPINRQALMRDAHRLAHNFRRSFTNYREALAYGLWAAWKSAKVRQDFQAVNRSLGPIRRTVTAREIKASREATRRCGSSLWAS